MWASTGCGVKQIDFSCLRFMDTCLSSVRFVIATERVDGVKNVRPSSVHELYFTVAGTPVAEGD